MGHRSSTWIGLLAVIGAAAILYAWNIPGQAPENTAVVPAATPERKPQPPKPLLKQERVLR